MKRIPLANTLVVLIGPSGAGKSHWAAENFSRNEIVSTDDLRAEYLDDAHREDNADVIFNEFDRRIRNRLELGLRVVADATHIRNTTRKRTVKLAEAYGAKVIYVVINRSIAAKMNHAGWRENVVVEGKPLIVRHEDTFQANEPSILCGDGGLVRTVIDLRKDTPEIIKPLPRTGSEGMSFDQAPLADLYSRGFKGVLAVGDVHGNLEGLQKMVEFARKEHLYLIFLGDIVDYATETLSCAEVVAETVFNGFGMSVMGNHERKVLKWLTKERPIWVAEAIEAAPSSPLSKTVNIFDNETGFTGKLSPGNAPTVNQIKMLNPLDRFQWETEFIALCSTMPHAVRMGQWLFTHGAANKYMFGELPFRFLPDSPEESFAMYGQSTGEYVNGFPERIYDWVEEIPPRTTVVVGHDCRSDIEPLVQAGAEGGRAIFLDTGCSKPERFGQGHLSALRLHLVSRRKVGFILENERFYSEHDL